MPKQKRVYEFYTKDSYLGEETIIATKKVAHPDKCKIYLKMQKDGFKGNIVVFGFSLKCD